MNHTDEVLDPCALFSSLFLLHFFYFGVSSLQCSSRLMPSAAANFKSKYVKCSHSCEMGSEVCVYMHLMHLYKCMCVNVYVCVHWNYAPCMY